MDMERRKRVRKRIIGPDMGKEWKRICLGWIRTVVLLILAAYLLVTYVVQRVDVYGDSMSPVLDGKDVLLVEKLTPKIGTLERFDMVVFRYQYRDNLYYIKRIVGLPGETVQIADGKVWINGEALEDDFGVEPIEKGKRAEEPIVLGEDEYFVLGDNRNHSSDSRDSDIGNLKSQQIVGKAMIRIWPVKRIKVFP